ncbi:uncharacterized protein [Parasteatoda tepidariorum]|uniref:uncharacterized protein n=1 Tax=Parasteatoda tepidariorum TaxID=114398 RepID=UPI001C71F3EA|nr:uncharacterized protein LOC122273829 [Parasteatoda tepidariorum]
MESIQAATAENVKRQELYDATQKFSSFSDLKSKLPDTKNSWNIIKSESYILFMLLDVQPVTEVTISSYIDSNCEAKAYVKKTEIKVLKNFKFPHQLVAIDTIDDILNELKKLALDTPPTDKDVKIIINTVKEFLKSLLNVTSVCNDVILFIIDQLSYIGDDKHAYRYSAETLIFASLIYTISPNAYRFVRKSGNIILPHPNTIRNICLKSNISPQFEQSDEYFLKYIQQKFKFLNEDDKTVLIMLDEIHIKEYFDYKSGNIVGTSYDGNCTSSAQVFMLKSVLSSYKDVVHVLPVKKITGEILHEFLNKVILGLEELGFFVISVTTDNNSINRKAMSLFVNPPKLQFVYPHPIDNNRPLFFLIDFVHLLKCIRNNWLNQKNPDKCFFYPMFGEKSGNDVGHNFYTASFSALKTLYDIELNSLAKFGFKLSLKSLNPSSFERQNVKLVLQIFNEFVPQGLLELGKNHNIVHYENTANFIKIINNWWNIVNVKTPTKGFHLKNEFQYPLSYKNERSINFLNKFLDWLDAWESMKCDAGMFSRETHGALKLSTEGILQLMDYCVNELNFKYIMPGKFHTDDLESRFGCYRQLAGCQYNISTRQLFECEAKLRLKSLLYLNIPTKSFGLVQVTELLHNEHFAEEFQNDKIFSSLKIMPPDLSSAKTQLPVIVYVAGYCAFSALKKPNCLDCREIHLFDKQLPISKEYNYTQALDRGSLLLPKKHVVNAVLLNYIIVKKLCFEYEAEFNKQINQRNVVTNLTKNYLVEKDLLGNEEFCPSGHYMEKFLDMVVWSSTNVFLNNYTKTKNDALLKENKNAALLAEVKRNKRKIETLSKNK